MKTESAAFGSVVRDLLDEQGLTIRGLSRRSGIPERTLHNIVHAHQLINLEQAFAIARGLGVPATELITRSENRCASTHYTPIVDDAWKPLSKPRMTEVPLDTPQRRPWAARLDQTR